MFSRDGSYRVAYSFLRNLLVFLVVALTLHVPEAEAGCALRLYYHDIKGDKVADLLASPRFPHSPSARETHVNGLARIDRGGDNWGAWVRGYLEAPITGNYRFLLASDNGAEFWLSTNHEAFQVRKIIENTTTTGVWDFRAKSEPVPLEAGQKYYFEFYHKEGVGSDHASVGWEMPDGTSDVYIPSHRFMPVPVDSDYQAVDKPAVFLSEFFGRPTSTLTNTTATEGSTLLLATSPDGTQPMSFQWFRNGKVIPGASLSSLTVTNVQLADNGDRYSVIASNALGSDKLEAVLTVNPDSKAPTVLSAVSTGHGNTIAVFFSEALDGATVLPQNFQLNHGAVIDSVRLVRGNTVIVGAKSLIPGKTYKLQVRDVRDASRRNVVAAHEPLVIDAGLLAWLRFDSKEGDDVVPDSSGNYNSAVLMNGARLNTQGVHGACLELDGTNAHAVLPSGFKDFAKGMSVVFWAKPMTNGQWARFFELGNGPARENILVARDGRTGHLVFENYGAKATHERVTASDVIEDGAWQHFAAVINPAGEAAVYKNGRLASKSKILVAPATERTSNFIGRSNWAQDAYYKGFLDDFRIYERPLSISEIRAMAESRK